MIPGLLQFYLCKKKMLLFFYSVLCKPCKWCAIKTFYKQKDVHTELFKADSFAGKYNITECSVCVFSCGVSELPYSIFFKEMTCKYVILASFCIEFCWLRICSLLVSPILNSQSGFLEIFRIHKNNFLFASKQPLRKKTGIGETMWWIVWKCIICQFIYSKLTPYESLMSSSDSFTNFLMYCQFK